MRLVPRRRTGAGLLRPAFGGAAVLALAGVTALAVPNLRSTGGTAHLAAATGKIATTPTTPSASTSKDAHQARIDAIWAAAHTRRPEPAVTVTTPDRQIDCDHLKCIALTFDDGPSPGNTERLLTVLAAKHVHATFMLVGQMVAGDPHAAAAEAKAGNMIGIHTWRHQSLRGRSVQSIADDIVRTSNEIIKASGYRPQVVRPPYGAVGPKTPEEVPYPLIKWAVDPDDWKDRNADTVYHRVTSAAAPGSIVLMHDTYRTTVAAVPRIIDFFAARGYTFVTVSELYESKLKAHRIYYGRERAVAANRAADRKHGVDRAPYVDPAGVTAPQPTEPAPAAGPQAPTTDAATVPAPPSSARRRSAGRSTPAS